MKKSYQLEVECTSCKIPQLVWFDENGATIFECLYCGLYNQAWHMDKWAELDAENSYVSERLRK